ncbi:glycosyltransferase family 2 protein [bacterium]|nr:glycosyltransferase family 2 protein [bacterium]
MSKSLPFVSVIVPCRNEERFISKCLDSIINQNYPKEKLEVLVVDGMSEDKTREIIKDYERKYSFIRFLMNQKKVTPAGMNIGIKQARGEIVIKMDAHSVYPKDYIFKCVKHLIDSGADNVGGVLRTIPSKNTFFSKAIAISLSHFFGSATSYFRIGAKKPLEVDTVAFGCYWKKMFEKIGLYNEKMAKIEDFELNWRIRKQGGRIMLFPDIVIYYYPSSENLRDFFWHNFTDGIWSTYPMKFGFFSLSFRHLVPLFFVLAIIFSLLFNLYLFIFIIFSYFIISFYFSLEIARKEKNIKFFFIMPVVFFCRHFGYGFGSLWGIIKIFLDNGR